MYILNDFLLIQKCILYACMLKNPFNEFEHAQGSLEKFLLVKISMHTALHGIGSMSAPGAISEWDRHNNNVLYFAFAEHRYQSTLLPNRLAMLLNGIVHTSILLHHSRMVNMLL